MCVCVCVVCVCVCVCVGVGGWVEFHCAGAEERDGPCVPAMLNPRNIVLTVKQVVLLHLICVGFNP